VTGDLLAGLSVAVVVIPQSLAYAGLAGMPAVNGLYAAALPPLLAALFASSPYLMTGPVAVTALLTYGALSDRATPGSREYAVLGTALALLVGLVRVALGLLRAGWLAYLMSQPVLLGFVPAAALLITASQTANAVGVSDTPDYDNQVFQAGWALGHPGHWAGTSVLLTAGSR
jgi:SulP family sulfate permease